MSSEYVNADGDPISIERLKLEAKHAKKKPAAVHKATGIDYQDWMLLGYLVTGFTRAMIDAAKAKREDEIREWQDVPKGPKPLPFDETLWLNQTKPKKVRAAPYALREAADQCAELAKRAGWIRVQVEEVKKPR